MSEPTLYRYAFPNVKHEGWAVFLLDSFGMLSVASDFGNYVYHWPRDGWGPYDFRKFLLQIDNGYLIGKLDGGRSRIRGDKTKQRIKEEICRLRRDLSLGKDEARDEWDHLQYHDFEDDSDFTVWHGETKLEAAWELCCHGPEPRLVAFAEKVWPRLRERLREALAEEAA